MTTEEKINQIVDHHNSSFGPWLHGDASLKKNLAALFSAEMEKKDADYQDAKKGMFKCVEVALQLREQLSKKDAEIAQNHENWKQVVDLSVKLWKKYDIPCGLGQSITLAVLNAYEYMRKQSEFIHAISQSDSAKISELDKLVDEKDKEIKDLKFTAYARLKQIDLLEKRVEELV